MSTNTTKIRLAVITLKSLLTIEQYPWFGEIMLSKQSTGADTARAPIAMCGYFSRNHAASTALCRENFAVSFQPFLQTTTGINDVLTQQLRLKLWLNISSEFHFFQQPLHQNYVAMLFMSQTQGLLFIALQSSCKL